MVEWSRNGKKKRGQVPRFVVVGGLSKSVLGLAENFERAAHSLPYEEEFRDVEIVALHVHRHGRTHDLRLVVDRGGNVDVALCERVGARLNAALESESDPYTLSVESPGLDRPLLRPADYERFRDRDVCVQTTLPIERERTHRGKLLGVRGNAAVLQTARGELPIPLEMIKSANLEFDYRAALKRDKRERRDDR
jgi:ribosome maturation factor RimP